MKFKNIGNIVCDLQKPIQFSRAGLIVTPSLALKVYSMLRIGEEIDVVAAKSFVEKKVLDGEISPELSGMGFTIFSNGVINTTVWGAEYPILGRNHVWFCEDGLDKARKLDLNSEGAYCAYEAQLLAFEGKQWIRYLNSDKTEEAKRAYFSSSMLGTFRG